LVVAPVSTDEALAFVDTVTPIAIPAAAAAKPRRITIVVAVVDDDVGDKRDDRIIMGNDDDHIIDEVEIDVIGRIARETRTAAICLIEIGQYEQTPL
jgi:hypothetical protein